MVAWPRDGGMNTAWRVRHGWGSTQVARAGPANRRAGGSDLSAATMRKTAADMHSAMTRRAVTYSRMPSTYMDSAAHMSSANVSTAAAMPAAANMPAPGMSNAAVPSAVPGSVPAVTCPSRGRSQCEQTSPPQRRANCPRGDCSAGPSAFGTPSLSDCGSVHVVNKRPCRGLVKAHFVPPVLAAHSARRAASCGGDQRLTFPSPPSISVGPNDFRHERPSEERRTVIDHYCR